MALYSLNAGDPGICRKGAGKVITARLPIAGIHGRDI
jgi:hypothetical protein